MYNVKKSDLYRSGSRATPRRARSQEYYVNRTRQRHLRTGNYLVRLTTMALLLGALSLLLWAIG